MTRRLAGPPDTLAPDLIWALRQLETTFGRIGVTALPDEIGCSRKHLTVRFRREFGLAPKLFARVARFSRAVQLLRRGRVANWAQVAIDCGYSDQAHLTRDFCAFSRQPAHGVSPPQTARRRRVRRLTRVGRRG
jgi:transcriptional regulator GlxA family with amidase domain